MVGKAVWLLDNNGALTSIDLQMLTPIFTCPNCGKNEFTGP